MHLVKTTREFIHAQQLIPPHSTIIVGLSGGPDSVALLHVLHTLAPQLQCPVVAAHLNHGWRPTADADEATCKTIAQQLGITFIATHAAELQHQAKNTGSREDFGRRMRRAFFSQLAQQYPNARIALGHHANDQHETFFIRLIRGAGLTGLVGIRPQEGIYIRPLLHATKQDILAYLTHRSIAYCIDETNTDPKHLRNRIRHQLLPALHACDPRNPRSLTSTMKNLAQADDFISHYTQRVFEHISTTHEGRHALVLNQFFQEHPYIQAQLLLKLICKAHVPFTPSTGLFEELLRFLRQRGEGIHTLYGSWQLHKKQGLCWINSKI